MDWNFFEGCLIPARLDTTSSSEDVDWNHFSCILCKLVVSGHNVLFGGRGLKPNYNTGTWENVSRHNVLFGGRGLKHSCRKDVRLFLHGHNVLFGGRGLKHHMHAGMRHPCPTQRPLRRTWIETITRGRRKLKSEWHNVFFGRCGLKRSRRCIPRFSWRPYVLRAHLTHSS